MEHAACRILQPGLALVGEVEITVAREDEVVQTAKRFRIGVGKHRCYGAVRGIKQQQTLAMIRDKNAAVFMNLEPIRLAVVLGNQMKLAVRCDLEYASIRNVRAIQVAGTIE